MRWLLYLIMLIFLSGCITVNAIVVHSDPTQTNPTTTGISSGVKTTSVSKSSDENLSSTKPLNKEAWRNVPRIPYDHRNDAEYITEQLLNYIDVLLNHIDKLNEQLIYNEKKKS